MDLETSRANMIKYFGGLGINQAALLSYLGVKSIKDIDYDMVVELRGLANALKEGTATLQEVFESASTDSEDIAKDARNKAEEAIKKASKANTTIEGEAMTESK